MKAAKFATKKSWDEPTNLIPEVGFVSSWNTDTYGTSVIANDFPDLRVQTLRKGDGKLCEMN